MYSLSNIKFNLYNIDIVSLEEMCSLSISHLSWIFQCAKLVWNWNKIFLRSQESIFTFISPWRGTNLNSQHPRINCTNLMFLQRWLLLKSSKHFVFFVTIISLWRSMLPQTSTQKSLILIYSIQPCLLLNKQLSSLLRLVFYLQKNPRENVNLASAVDPKSWEWEKK